MIKKIASDAIGLSDVGKIISPEDFDKTQADDYVRHEDGEKIEYLIMTKADEYCFTNLALIHVDGQNATSSKRQLKRYPYFSNPISQVMLETAGRIDIDVEIKFRLGHQNFNIDVHKDQLEQLKDLYKALCYMSETQQDSDRYIQLGESSLNRATEVLKHTRLTDVELVEQYKAIADLGYEWMSDVYKKHHKKDYGDVFERYIYN